MDLDQGTEVRLYDHDVCDFCSASNPTWSYPAQTYHDKQLEATSVGDWLACDECAALIQRNEWTKLARRALLIPLMAHVIQDAGEDFVVSEALRMHKDFRKNRTGKVERNG